MKNARFAAILSLMLVSASSLADTINLFVAGTGVVGGELLAQIANRTSSIHKREQLEVRVIAIANTKSLLKNPQGIEVSNWRSGLSESSCQSTIVAEALGSTLPNKMFVDCTSDQGIAKSYEQLLSEGISVVTASKKANSDTLGYYKSLRAIRDDVGSKFIYDANVGAGLPMLSTVQALARSGEEISKIEGVLSGTLSFLFNTFGQGVAFSQVVRDAQKNGYTEPDPRDDLNGMDAARKLLILVREAGFELEMRDVEIQSFLPESCFKADSVEAFYVALQEYDASMAKVLEDAAQDGKRLAYIASFEGGKAKLSLQAIDSEHPFYHLSGCDNILSITTPSYQKSPIVIRGPGAGAGVTASRVLEGIVRAGLERRMGCYSSTCAINE